MPRFGQVVIGAPGAGKSTYCRAALNHLTAHNRDAIIVNLDPAAECPEAVIDICSLVEHSEVMSELDLGPNGALVYCMELLLENKEWLIKELERIPKQTYLIFDFPGQAELYSAHDCVEKLVTFLTSRDIRIAALYFTESRHAENPHLFTSALLATLASMLRLSLPAVNILSKIDVAPRLPARLETFTDPIDLEFLFGYSDDDDEEGKPIQKK